MIHEQVHGFEQVQNGGSHLRDCPR